MIFLILRNNLSLYLGQILYKNIGLYGSDFVNVEVYINNEYWVVYSLCEQNEISSSMRFWYTLWNCSILWSLLLCNNSYVANSCNPWLVLLNKSNKVKKKSKKNDWAWMKIKF